MITEVGRTIGSCVEVVIRRVVAASSRRTSAFIMFGSKCSGAWSYENNSNQMLALRCAKYNGTFEQVFQRHQQWLREV